MQSLMGCSAALALAATSLGWASPALAQDTLPGPLPGPFACSLGDTQLMLEPDETGGTYSGALELSGEYADADRSAEPGAVILTQRYAGWRTVYSNADMTMVINADAAMLYGDFGTSDCFASRSSPVGEGWQYGDPGGDEAGSALNLGSFAADGDWRDAGLGHERWREGPQAGAAITWGGNVRAGPSETFARVAGVPLGVTVTLLGITNRLWLGEYPWYKVRLPNGREGYIAGGLLCTRDSREGFYNARDCTG